ncbi:hypothetical protein LXA43DRAFT_1068645 [Ganoderma leucocontextum]|nr:hypothetical protein LXA43DRAFT_1068645 [Ganoderma leucocontextum]
MAVVGIDHGMQDVDKQKRDNNNMRVVALRFLAVSLSIFGMSDSLVTVVYCHLFQGLTRSAIHQAIVIGKISASSESISHGTEITERAQVARSSYHVPSSGRSLAASTTSVLYNWKRQVRTVVQSMPVTLLVKVARPHNEASSYLPVLSRAPMAPRMTVLQPSSPILTILSCYLLGCRCSASGPSPNERASLG